MPIASRDNDPDQRSPSVVASPGAPTAASPPKSPASGVTVSDDKIVVLLMSSSPLDASPLDVGRDVKQISRCLQTFPSRDRLAFVQEWAVDIAELLQLLLKHKPNILHFSGHGVRSGQIVLEDGNGQARVVPTQALARLFETLNQDGSIQCVVLSACYAEPQARAIAEHVNFVVGITNQIHDVTAASFSAGFYSSLAAGKTFADAFALGLTQIALMENKEADIRLLTKPGQDARQMRLLLRSE